MNDYRVEAEEFLSAIDREYYLHFAGLKDEYEIEPIYARHARLFSRESGRIPARGGQPRAAQVRGRRVTSSRP